MSIYSNFGDNEKYRAYKARKIREKFKPIKNNIFIVLGIMLLSALLGFLSFIFIYWCLSIINMHYAFKSLIAFIIAYSLLFLITPDTDFKTRIRGASRSFVFMATLLCLLIGFRDYGAGVLDDYIRSPKANIYATDSATLAVRWTNITTVELDTLKQKGEEWSTEKVFPAGSSVIIKISNQEVRLVGLYILKPGIYEKKFEKDEKLTFKGVADNTSLISVSY